MSSVIIAIEKFDELRLQSIMMKALLILQSLEGALRGKVR